METKLGKKGKLAGKGLSGQVSEVLGKKVWMEKACMKEFGWKKLG